MLPFSKVEKGEAVGLERKTTMIDQATLHKILEYDALSGAFFWKIQPSRSVQVGARAGSPNPNGWTIGFDGRHYRARRLAWIYSYGAIPVGMEVRICNGDQNDVRLSNIELQTTRQRMERHSNSVLGAKGVWAETVSGHTRYGAKLTREGRVVHRSYHATLEEAIRARLEALAAFEAAR